jgi:hypothetical protein
MASAESVHRTGVWGGVHLDRSAGQEISGRDTRAVATALLRLAAAELGSAGDPTPRLDGARLVREIVGRSYRLPRARREEAEPQRLLVAIDVSGSCAVWCSALAAGVERAAEADPRIRGLLHSNGEPVGEHGEPYWDVVAPGSHGWGWEEAAGPAAVVVALGDSDAAAAYEACVARGAVVHVMHPYGSRQAGVRRADHRREEFDVAAVATLTLGVREPRQIAEAAGLILARRKPQEGA